jgi:hypothetical protein
VSAAFPPSSRFEYVLKRAVVVVEGAAVRPLSRRSTMAIIGIVLGVSASEFSAGCCSRLPFMPFLSLLA